MPAVMGLTCGETCKGRSQNVSVQSCGRADAYPQVAAFQTTPAIVALCSKLASYTAPKSVLADLPMEDGTGEEVSENALLTGRLKAVWGSVGRPWHLWLELWRLEQ